MDAGILPQIAEPTLKESFHHAVYMAKNKEPPSIPGSPFVVTYRRLELRTP